MDKELLRIVIIATGLMIIMGMLTWSYLRNKTSQEVMDLYDDPEAKGQRHNPLTVDDEKMGSEPIKGEAVDHHYFDQEDAVYEPEEDNLEPPPRVAVPAII